MKKIIIGALIALVGLVGLVGLSGCSGWKNSSALLGVKIANEQLEKDNSPVRYTGVESEYGVSSKPYLLGKITPSVADPLLKKDVLKLIMKKEEVQSVELMQTRFLSRSLDPLTYYEIWVIKRVDDNVLHAHTVQLRNSPQGGVDIVLLGAARVFEEMLKEEKV
ncbi:MAG TPA: hypothetical protein VIM82_07985 [Sulfurimonas sp.]